MAENKFTLKEYERMIDDIIDEFFEQHNAQFDSKEALKVELLQREGIADEELPEEEMV